MRLLKYLVYFGLLAGAIALGWPRWALLGQALACEACYFPLLPEPVLWLPLGLLLLGYTLVFLLAALRRWDLGLAHHAVVVALVGAVVVARVFEGTGQDGARPDPPPAWCLSMAAGRLQAGLHAGPRDRPLPLAAAEVEALVRSDAGLPPSGLRSHGWPQPVALRVVPGATGPVLDVRDDRPGTIVYAVSADRRRYWITLVGIETAPHGEPRVLRDEDGAPLVLSKEDVEAAP